MYLLIPLLLLAGDLSWAAENFICTDNAVIAFKDLCNGKNDCTDTSDENRAVCKNIICSEKSFHCHYGACIPKNKVCDGKIECTDGSDEKYCAKSLGTCKKDEFQCDNGKCIPLKKICDETTDCTDSSDEQDDLCMPQFCPANTYRCKIGGCINLKARCDGIVDCIDGSDESETLCKSLKCSADKCDKVRQSIRCPPVISQRLIVKCESESGILPCDKPLPVGTTVRYSCKDYYIPANKKHLNNTMMICQPDGTWNKEKLKCYPACGKAETDIAPLIVNGWLTKPGKYQWHAVLYIHESGNWTFWCGGSLVSERAVLTAAHCTWNIDSTQMRVALGKYFSDFAKRQDYTQIFDIEKIIMHPLYQDVTGNFGSDIAILLLNTTVQFSAMISPVCLDWELDDITAHLKEKKLGMGVTEDETQSDQMRVAQLPVVSDTSCIESQEKDFKKYITFTSFCAGWRNGTGVCNGDSGGGLVFPSSQNHEKWVLQGIVSVSPRKLGTSFCDPKYYTVFTKVGMYIKWIRNILGQIYATRGTNIQNVVL